MLVDVLNFIWVTVVFGVCTKDIVNVVFVLCVKRSNVYMYSFCK